MGASSVVSLYRDYLRTIRRLPYSYLRSFYRIKAQDDVRSIITCHGLRAQRCRRISRDIRRIKSAINGNSSDFARVLDIAYGRKGKLRWELMQPFLTAPEPLPSPPIIPGVPKSRPPVYSPVLASLLTSHHSRAKPLSSVALVNPPKLPERANPKSEEARLLGPLSKRRELNFRWRYYMTEWKKVKPPLSITDTRPDQPGQCKVGFADLPVFANIEDIVGPTWTPRPLTRRQRGRGVINDVNQTTVPRWLRRRYRELLARTPILSLVQKGNGTRYEVSQSPLAFLGPERFKSNTLPEIDETDLAWFAQGSGIPEKSQLTKAQ